MPRTKQATKKANKKAETRVAQKAVENRPKTEDEIIDQLVVKIRQNLTVKDSKYVQVNENFKKVGPGLSLSGLLRLYKQPGKENFILIPEYKVSGPTQVIERILGRLSTSLETLRAKEGGVVDIQNYETYVVARLPEKETVASVLISSDKIAELAKLVKEHKIVKEDRDEPKKKKAQRRKSHTGIQVSQVEKIAVDNLTEVSQENLVDLLKRLAEQQKGLDVTGATATRVDGHLTLSGSKSFTIKGGSKSKRLLIDSGALRGLAAESTDKLGEILKELGLSAAESKVYLDKFKPAKKVEAKTKKTVAAKPEAKEDKEATTAKPTAKAAHKEKSAAKPVEVTKAKTRDVKPRTSRDGK
jgi:hypothetical protein